VTAMPRAQLGIGADKAGGADDKTPQGENCGPAEFKPTTTGLSVGVQVPLLIAAHHVHAGLVYNNIRLIDL